MAKQLNDEQKDTIVDALENVGLYDALRPYSGRGMYGDRCIAFTTDNDTDAFRFFVALAVEDEDLADLLAQCAKTDGMGMGMVVYFPGITADVDEDDEDD